MHSPVELFLTTAQTVIALLGFIINGFVMVVNLRDWKFGSALSTSDYFICTVALSNFFLQLWTGFDWFCDFLGNYNSFCQRTFSFKIISTHCSFKVGALLCLFYCTTIVISKKRLFRYYHRRLHKSFKIEILRSVISIFVVGFPLFGVKKEQLAPNSGSLSLSIGSISIVNNTIIDTSFALYRIMLLSFGYTYPLLISLVSASFIIISLKNHMKRMQNTMENKDGVFIDAHRRAAITVFSIIILILMYFVTSVIILLSIFPNGDLRLLVCEFVSTLYAPALGIVLIRGNSKLRKASSRIRMKAIEMLRVNGFMKENISVHIILN